MEPDKKGKTVLDSDDEEDEDSSPDVLFNLPSPVFGKLTKRGGMYSDDDDDGNSNDNDDLDDDTFEDFLQSSQNEKKKTSVSMGLTTTNKDSFKHLLSPKSTEGLTEGAPSTQLLDGFDSATMASPVPLSDSNARRSVLKTVHSGRSLSSAESQKGPVEEVQRNNSSDNLAPDPAAPDQKRTLLQRTVGVRPLFRKVPPKNNKVNARTALFTSRMATRRSRFGRDSSSLDMATLNRIDTPPSQARRYKPDDFVLVCNHQSRWATLVNRYGFPPREGATPEEQAGPYIYVMCTVKEVHFEEFAAYYTVDRCDTGAEQRADADFMEPLRSDRGKQAALRAATQLSGDDLGGSGEFEGSGLLDRSVEVPKRAKMLLAIQTCLVYLMLPFMWLFDFLYYYVVVSCLVPCWQSFFQFVRRQARFLLNGLSPYVCRVRLTMVNFIVLFSTWYMFIDQARLVFFPAGMDNAVAAVNLAVWLMLVLELVFQVFIRPDGFKNLIISDKAYAPTTVRFINMFHLCVETLSLMLFVPEWFCLISTYECDDRLSFSFHNAILLSVTGPTRLDSFYGKAFLALIRLRVFGLVRHWKNMWITNTFINMTWKSTPNGIISNFIPQRRSQRSTAEHKGTKTDDPQNKDRNLANASTIGTALMVTNSYRALTILWVITGIFPLLSCFSTTYTNSMAPAMTKQLQATNLLAVDTNNSTCTFIAESVLAWMVGFTSPGFTQDSTAQYLVNLQISPRTRCQVEEYKDRPITEIACASLQARAAFEMIPADDPSRKTLDFFCETWETEITGTKAEVAHQLGLRTGSIRVFEEIDLANLTFVTADGMPLETILTNYSIVSSFDESYTVRQAALGALLLQLSLLIMVLGGLSVLRRDAEVLVLKPLRYMLKIVARYARNPLVPPKIKRRPSFHRGMSARLHADDTSNDSDASSDVTNEEEAADDRKGQAEDEAGLGSYETEQLITAVTKITDLLRKCWGVAGADIISTNLATREGALTEVFNPTVAGKSVYALFGFAAINGFDHALRNLGRDIMILINDVAAVLHGEVFRWGFGESGQCNKNLGSAFLMVFRIGLVKEVVEKLEQAQDVIFNTGHNNTKTSHQAAAGKKGRHHHNKGPSAGGEHGGGSAPVTARRKSTLTQVSMAKNTAATIKRKIKRNASVKAMSLSLQSLPGISAFTDRAVIGMLKSFAGIYRDNKIRNWNNDFRLSAGVGTFTVSMIYGMDAGWAVEGAVGSEYKIDATYLSPHVNMASRMMSACKQYGVSILLSQAVQELMSDVAQSKLRHLDTVTVKGSSVKQRIYTYDARPKGVDFFLYSRSDEQADFEAERYSPKSWHNDSDLKAMRQHVSEDFLDEFTAGRRAYLAGNWKDAIKRLERANEIMIENALEDGYLEDEFEELAMRSDFARAAEELKLENGDGPSLYLINFMKSHGGVAPDRWEGWHPLTSK